MIDPKTLDEWREATTLAEGALDIDSARQYGLITGGPVVNVDRCLDIIKRARAQGIVTVAEDVNRRTANIVKALA